MTDNLEAIVEQIDAKTLKRRSNIDFGVSVAWGLALSGPIEVMKMGWTGMGLMRAGMIGANKAFSLGRGYGYFREAWMHKFGLSDRYDFRSLGKMVKTYVDDRITEESTPLAFGEVAAYSKKLFRQYSHEGISQTLYWTPVYMATQVVANKMREVIGHDVDWSTFGEQLGVVCAFSLAIGYWYGALRDGAYRLFKEPPTLGKKTSEVSPQAAFLNMPLSTAWKVWRESRTTGDFAGTVQNYSALE